MNATSSPLPNPVLHRSYAHGLVDTDIPGWSLRCLQTSSGSLDGGARELHANGIQVLEEHYRHVATNHFGVAPAGCTGFVIPMRMHGDGVFDGQRWYSGGLCVWNTNREFNAIAPPTDMLCVVVNRGLLAEHIAQTEQIDLEPALLRASLVFGTPEAARPIARRIGELVSTAFDTDWEPSTPAAQKAIQQEVLESLAPALVDQLDVRHDHRGRFSHLVNVRRARELALAHSDTPLQVQDLCRELHVSRRTLQESFRVVLGIGPLAYLRALRLDGARRSLLNGHAVKEVADTWGFWHWSRFSQDYRRQFGELPSITSKRVKGIAVTQS